MRLFFILEPMGLIFIWEPMNTHPRYKIFFATESGTALVAITRSFTLIGKRIASTIALRFHTGQLNYNSD